MTKLMPKFEQHRTDFAYCQTITKRSSSAFYTAFSQLPLERAWSIYAVYAFVEQPTTSLMLTMILMV